MSSDYGIAVGVVVLILAIVGFVFASSYSRSLHAWHSELAVCEETLDSRVAVAKAARSQEVYLGQVLQAKSVKQDVKTAAQVNRLNQESAATLLERQARKPCEDRYDRPSFWP